MTWAVPRIRTILSIVDQSPEKRRSKTVGIRFRFPDNVPSHELGRILEHVNKAVQLTQNVVGNMVRGACFSVEINRNFCVAATNLLNERPQIHDGGVKFRSGGELFVVNRKNKRRGPALLLRKLGEIPITGDPQHFHPFALNGVGKRTNP